MVHLVISIRKEMARAYYATSLESADQHVCIKQFKRLCKGLKPDYAAVHPVIDKSRFSTRESRNNLALIESMAPYGFELNVECEDRPTGMGWLIFMTEPEFSNAQNSTLTDMGYVVEKFEHGWLLKLVEEGWEARCEVLFDAKRS